MAVHRLQQQTALVRDAGPRRLHAVAGTPLGKRSFGELQGGGKITILRPVDGGRVPFEVEPSDWPPIETVVDAVLYVGPARHEVGAAPGSYDNAAYVAELRRRAGIMSEVFGIDLRAFVDEEIASSAAKAPGP